MCCALTWPGRCDAKGDDEQAILQLEAAIKLRPDFIKARELLATLYLTRGR